MRQLGPVSLTDSDYTRLLKLKSDDGFETRDWVDWFRFKTAGIPLQDNIDEAINRNTATMLNMWMLNFAQNLVFHRVAHDKGVLQALETLPLENLHDAKDLVPVSTRDLAADRIIPVGPCIVVGRGPSVFKHKHLERLANAQFKTPPTIISTDGMLIECLRSGVTPDKFPNFFSISVDGHRSLIEKWYDDPLVDQYGSKLKVVVVSTVANNVVRRCLQANAQVYMLHAIFDNLAAGDESLTRMMMLTTQTDETNPLLSVQCLGNSGGLGWVVSWNLLRCSPSILIGMNYSYETDTKIEDTSYASKALAIGDLEGASKSIVEVLNPHDGKTYRTDNIFMHYKKSFLTTLESTPPPLWVKTWNCTEGGILFGKGIEWRKFEDVLKGLEK